MECSVLKKEGGKQALHKFEVVRHTFIYTLICQWSWCAWFRFEGK